MSTMFVTGYSYKGGVGRTTALANIACLLAEDRKHPQKVLLWDFDLEAPGLQGLFPPKDKVGFGFVELAYQFSQTRTLPDPKDFIYESEVDGIHVLHAGSINDEYCERLSLINWLSFFDDYIP